MHSKQETWLHEEQLSWHKTHSPVELSLNVEGGHQLQFGLQSSKTHFPF